PCLRVSVHASAPQPRLSRRARSVAPAVLPVSAELRRILRPRRLIPLQGPIEELSAQQTHGLADPLAKARSIYDYVVAALRYDKSGTGRGNGDAIWACTAQRGNCTGLPSLLIGMMRAPRLPARF